MNTEEKRKREEKVVGQMIGIYCRGNKHEGRDSETGMCPECKALWDYAVQRSEHCPFMETKTFCSNCTVHCYAPEQREQIRKVMRYSGPRIMFYHPVMAMWHVITSAQEKKKRKQAEQ